MEMHVSLVGRRDLSGEIYRQLRAAILDGRVRGGEALPPTREFARRLGVSRTTVTVAYDRLISEGFADARVGAGTFASPQPALRRTAPRPAHALRPLEAWHEIPFPQHLWRDAEFDFRAGSPDARDFPYAAWRRLIADQLEPGAVGRGAYDQPAGHAPLREAIARHVGLSRGVQAAADDVVVTNGTQQAIDLIARVLLRPGDLVAVEDPGYGVARRLLASHGLTVVGVPVDGEGIVVERIPARARLVYVAPSHQFPLGVVMSLGRRIALLAWARRRGAAVVEDDYDSEFRFGGRPIEPLQLLDADGRVVYVGSFSKTMLPTLRLGFIVAPPSLRRALRAAKYVTDWHAPLPIQGAMAGFIDEGLFARHLRRMRRIYEARHRLIARVITRDFHGELELVPSAAGLHLCALAPTSSVARVRAVVERARELGVECQPLSTYATGDRPRAGIVLGYGAIATERIEEGLRRLRVAFGSVGRIGSGGDS
jgi:GntR family transcriptional regulator/MocR family aminotransferase